VPNVTIALSDSQARAIRAEADEGATLVQAVTRFVTRHADRLITIKRTRDIVRLREVDPTMADRHDAETETRLSQEV
jgi:hypothetical protein